MLRSASCGHCGGDLPLDCGLMIFRLPPRTVCCARCGTANATTPAYRSTWLAQQFFRGALLACTFLGVVPAFLIHDRFVGAAIVGVIAGFLTGLVIGVVLGVFVAPLVRIGLDMRHGMRQLDVPPADEQPLEAAPGAEEPLLYGPAEFRIEDTARREPATRA